jgi:hypothetical protein
MLFIIELLLIFCIFILSCLIIRFLIRLYDYIYDINHDIKPAVVVQISLAKTTHLTTNRYVMEIPVHHPTIIDYGI